MVELSKLETNIISIILDNDKRCHFVRPVLPLFSVSRRTFSGSGGIVEFYIAQPLKNSINGKVGSVSIRHSSLEHGGGATVFMLNDKSGYIEFYSIGNEIFVPTDSPHWIGAVVG